MEVGDVVELAKSFFVCYAASNDITWFTTKSQDERGILQFPLAISVKYVFLEAIEGFVETEEKLTPNKFFCLLAKRPSPHGNMYSVSYVEMEVWSACDIFAQEW